MAVVFDAVTTGVTGPGTATSITFTHTLGTLANRAYAVFIEFDRAGVSNFSVTVGGDTAMTTPLTGTDSDAVGAQGRTMIFGQKTTLTGAQTVTISWATLARAIAGLVSASGVDQTTVFNNGTFVTGASTTPSLSVTSTSGDMTFAGEGNDAGGDSSPSQTSQWLAVLDADGIRASSGSTAGTGTATHSWTIAAGGNWSESGINFIQAGGAAAVIPNILMAPMVPAGSGELTAERRWVVGVVTLILWLATAYFGPVTSRGKSEGGPSWPMSTCPWGSHPSWMAHPAASAPGPPAARPRPINLSVEVA